MVCATEPPQASTGSIHGAVLVSWKTATPHFHDQRRRKETQGGLSDLERFRENQEAGCEVGSVFEIPL